MAEQGCQSVMAYLVLWVRLIAQKADLNLIARRVRFRLSLDSQYRETPGKEIATVDYTDKAELPHFSSVLQISTYLKSPVSKVSTGLDFKLYSFGELDWEALSVDLSLSQSIGILPEILYLI